jgi:zinc ribbon protein
MADVINWRFTLGPVEGLVIVIALGILVFTIWMLVDAITRPAQQFSSPGAKTGWIVGLIAGMVIGFGFLGVIVAIAYLVSVKLPAGSRQQTPAWSAPPPPGSPAPPPPAAPTQSPNCRNCGVKLVAGSRFCHSCGTPTT